ncbi:MAG TPA: DNA mismatch repair endonuclease MutL [Candidatus Limnocylindrales bacterium]|nr:DNA mismatch repair endonuclease MutL [Candidatus Limnocylindrales bacterium]
MSSRIKVLPEKVANQIAAGEVIERPASVVKELVENALDARTSRVIIEVRGSGQGYIRVTDTGYGMNPEEAILAFERHATSKVASLEDLFRIQTFGFRGEALPSIASVSKVSLTSKMNEMLTGVRVEVQGGKILKVEEVAANPGTSVEVRDLFYNTPARLKFLKSTMTELSHISDVVIDEALAHPEISFTLIHNARETIQAAGGVQPLERIASIFGRSFARELVEVHQEAYRLVLTGFLGLPSFHRANKNYQKIFVNRRPIRDRVLSHAIQEAYETLIPKGRYPVAILFLQIPPEWVDVNVHPAKVEVRFLDPKGVHDFIVDAIRNTLRNSLKISTLPSFPGEFPSSHRLHAEDSVQQAISNTSWPAILSSEDWSSIPEREDKSKEWQSEDREICPALIQSYDSESPRRVFSTLHPIGQFHETYILAQTSDELILIDQHAAHERVLYEEFKKKLKTSKIDIQPLLFPVTLEFSYRESHLLLEHLGFLSKYGLELEPFGGSTYILKAVPALLMKANYPKLLADVVDQLADPERAPDPEKKMDQILTVMACHAAVRANDPLNLDQITALLRQMDQVELPYTCPHGRPTTFKISVYELEKKFRRT